LPRKSDVLLVVAPIGEETLFRGFLFRGWHRSLRNAWPAIIVTAALWALIRGSLIFMALLKFLRTDGCSWA
jgi:CAAX protease family protein